MAFPNIFNKKSSQEHKEPKKVDKVSVPESTRPTEPEVRVKPKKITTAKQSSTTTKTEVKVDAFSKSVDFYNRYLRKASVNNTVYFPLKDILALCNYSDYENAIKSFQAQKGFKEAFQKAIKCIDDVDAVDYKGFSELLPFFTETEHGVPEAFPHFFRELSGISQEVSETSEKVLN